MPAPKKQYKAAKTVKAKSGSKQFTDWYKEYFTQAKQDIINHPARNISMCSAKGPGKTDLSIATIMKEMESDPDVSGLALRKYSKGAIANLAQSIINSLLKARYDDVRVPEYKRSTDRVYRDTDHSNVFANQAIRLSSFEDLETFSGISPSKAGKWGTILFDELVPMTDRGKIPSSGAV